MKHYNLDSEFTFGKYKGKKVIEVIEIDYTYLTWCIKNLDHFYLKKEVISEINQIIPSFTLTEDQIAILENRYRKWESNNEQKSKGKIESTGPEAYGYKSWSEMAFKESFEGDCDSWNHYNQ